MPREGTAVISVVVLQNSMDILKGALGSSTETYATSTNDGSQVTGIEAVRVTDIKEEEDQEARTIPVIKMEPKVSVVPVVSVCTFLIGYVQNCLPVYQCVLVKQKFDIREWILSSF
jgi:nitrogenase molybdenum-iron protein alpha/beta subunit